MTQEPLSNCCYAPLVQCEDDPNIFWCSACGEMADPATDTIEELNDPGERFWCKWCGETTDHQSYFCPVKLAEVEAATHQL